MRRRVILLFKNKWWNELLAAKSGSDAKLGFLFGHDGALPVWWSSEPLEAALLTGWAGGKKALDLSHQTDEDVIDIGLDSIAEIFAVSRAWLD